MVAFEFVEYVNVIFHRLQRFVRTDTHTHTTISSFHFTKLSLFISPLPRKLLLVVAWTKWIDWSANLLEFELHCIAIAFRLNVDQVLWHSNRFQSIMMLKANSGKSTTWSQCVAVPNGNGRYSFRAGHNSPGPNKTKQKKSERGRERGKCGAGVDHYTLATCFPTKWSIIL